MAKGIKTGGRKPGSVNKVTASVKAALSEAFERLGGVDGLVAWAASNKDTFYTMWSKSMPKELTGSDGGAIKHKVTVVVKRDRNFFGRSASPDANASPDPDSGEPSAVQNGRVRPSVGEDGSGPDGSS